MTIETSKEIIRHYVYGMNVVEIAQLYGYDIDAISKLIVDNEEIVNQEKEYRQIIHSKRKYKMRNRRIENA